MNEEKEDSNNDADDDTWYNDTTTFTAKSNTVRGRKRKCKNSYRNTNKKYKRTSSK